MSESQRQIDRRTLLGLMAAAAAASTGGGPFGPGGARVAAAGQAAMPAGVEPFEVRVGDDELEDLSRRLQSPRWPPDSPGEPWSYGTDRAYLEELIAYWRDEYDWRAHEAALNAFNHYTTTIEGQRVHFIRQAGVGPAPLALVMTHGWPGTIWEMLPSVMALSDPAAHGGDPADAFDVIVPSIPGFGFSGEPPRARTSCVPPSCGWP